MWSHVLLAALLISGCTTPTPEAAPVADPGAPLTDAQKAQLRAKFKAKMQAKAANGGTSKAKSKTKSKGKAARTHRGADDGLAGADPNKPPPGYRLQAQVKGTMLFHKAETASGVNMTRAELMLSWDAADGVEAGEYGVFLGNVPGTCDHEPPTTIKEADSSEITPLWSARCTTEKGVAIMSLYQAATMLVVMRSVLDPEGKLGPWVAARKIVIAKGAQLTKD